MKSKEVQSFYIYKLTTQDVIRNAVQEDGEIVYKVNLSYGQALRNAQIVGIGDSQVLMQLREIAGSTYTPRSLRELEERKEELQNEVNTEENAKE